MAREGLAQRLWLSLLVFLIAALSLPDIMFGFQREERSLKDFDSRVALLRAGLAPTSEQLEALDEIKARMDGNLRIRWNKQAGTPRHLFKRGGYLTSPSQSDLEQIGLDFLSQNRNLFRFSDADLKNLVLKKRYTTGHNGVTHVIFQQQFQGIRVFQGELRVNIDNLGRIINVAGDTYPGVALSTAPKISVQAATRNAAASVNPTLDFEPSLIEPLESPQGRAILRGGPFTKDISARLTIFPMADRATLAWEVMLPEPGTPNLYQILVDAGNGAVLFRHNLTRYLAHGLVYQEHPLATLPPFSGVRADISFEGDAVTPDPSVSPIGWVFGTETSGNNVTAAEDQNCDEIGTTASAPVDQTFDFPIDLSQDPLSYTNGVITNLFWQNNFCHDFLYELGFDEAAGNFQEDNLGRGGLGSDSVEAYSQLGCFPNNAFFLTNPEGINPVMGMGIFGYTTPRRDSAIDGDIIVHEYVHGLSTRLVGSLSGVQSGAMGEGWSDWFPGAVYDPDDGADRAVIGEYVTGLPTGIRRYAYSRDKGVNPLTYGDFCTGPRGCEVHDDGEIWAVTLWGLYKDLVDTYGLDPDNLPYPIESPYDGREIAYFLIVDGMKLTPANPSMLEARDGILLADQINNGGANHCLIWQAFAWRGMGYSACSGFGCTPGETGTGSDSVVTEAFDLPPECFGLTCVEDDSGVLDIAPASGGAGSTVTMTVRIQNAPNPVDALGFELAFDPALLIYTGFTRGPLVADFDMFDAIVPAEKPNVVRVGGFKATGGIAAGTIGELVYLHFNVGLCEQSSKYPLDLQELKDDIGSWSSTGGCFQCGCDGDVSGNGEITPQDALCVFQTYLGICPTACGPCEDICCDVTGDGDCTPADALCIFQKYLGIPSCLD